MTKVNQIAPISSATIWRWTPLTALGFLIAGRALFSMTPNPFVTVAPLIALAGGVALLARFVRPLRGGWMDATALSIAFANAGAWLAWMLALQKVGNQPLAALGDLGHVVRQLDRIREFTVLIGWLGHVVILFGRSAPTHSVGVPRRSQPHAPYPPSNC